MLASLWHLLLSFGQIGLFALGGGNSMLKLIEDESLRKKMKEKGWEHVRDRFSVQQLARQMAAHYYRLLEHNSF